MTDQRTNPGKVLRHGYYAAKLGHRFGDDHFSRLAEACWKSLGHTAPSVVDGVSCWTTDGIPGEVVRLCALDIFKDAPWRVLVRDLIGGQWT